VYIVDKYVKEAGHVVAGLSPYHCSLNPIELVWTQLKGYVARHKKSFKHYKVCQLVETGLGEVTAER
jgi:transposase